jgi:CubicO group peptidase (beta-lactamase class C family)
MSTNQKLRDGKETGYGYGWSVDAMGERKGIVRHGGVQPGATSSLYLIPQERFAVSILTNLEGGGRLGLDGLFTQIVDIVQK